MGAASHGKDAGPRGTGHNRSGQGFVSLGLDIICVGRWLAVGMLNISLPLLLGALGAAAGCRLGALTGPVRCAEPAEPGVPYPARCSARGPACFGPDVILGQGHGRLDRGRQTHYNGVLG